MTGSGKIIAFPPLPAARPAIGEAPRFEGYPRFAREFARPAPLLPREASPPPIGAGDE